MIGKRDYKALLKIGKICFDQEVERIALHAALDAMQITKVSAKVMDYFLAQAAALGLSWEPALGHIFLRYDDFGYLHLALTYKGAMQLCYATGQVSSIQSWTIRDGDTVQMHQGDWPIIRHGCVDQDRGSVKGSIAAAMLNGAVTAVTMERKELLMVAANGTDAWRSCWVDEMCKKQVIWRLLDQLPSVEDDRRAAAATLLAKYAPARLPRYHAPEPKQPASAPADSGDKRENRVKRKVKPIGVTQDSPSILSIL